MTRLYLVRHGETVYKADKKNKKIHGKIDIPLSKMVFVKQKQFLSGLKDLI